MPTGWLPRRAGSATETSSRPSPGAADIGGHAAFEREPQLFPPVGAEVGLPVEGGRVGLHVHHEIGPAAAAGAARHQGNQRS